MKKKLIVLGMLSIMVVSTLSHADDLKSTFLARQKASQNQQDQQIPQKKLQVALTAVQNEKLIPTNYEHAFRQGRNGVAVDVYFINTTENKICEVTVDTYMGRLTAYYGENYDADDAISCL